MHVGAVVQNVGSIACIAEVFETGLPLVERVVTVTGPGVRRPSNLIVPVGTRLRDVLEFCGGLTDDAAEIIFGGPMMGASQSDLRHADHQGDHGRRGADAQRGEAAARPTRASTAATAWTPARSS